jgi:hypothetical protein
VSYAPCGPLWWHSVSWPNGSNRMQLSPTRVLMGFRVISRVHARDVPISAVQSQLWTGLYKTLAADVSGHREDLGLVSFGLSLPWLGFRLLRSSQRGAPKSESALVSVEFERDSPAGLIRWVACFCIAENCSRFRSISRPVRL